MEHKDEPFVALYKSWRKKCPINTRKNPPAATQENNEAENNLIGEDTQAEKTTKDKGWVVSLKQKSNDKEEAEEKQQDKKKESIESKAVTQSTEEATQTQEITKTKNPESTNKPRGKVLKTTAKKQSQTEAQNRKRKNTNAQGGSAPKRVQSTKEKKVYT